MYEAGTVSGTLTSDFHSLSTFTLGVRPSAEPVLGPGIGGVGTSSHFPEAGFVLGEEGDALDELRAFPGVKLGDDHAGAAAVLEADRGAVEGRRDEHVVIEAGGQAHVGRVAVVTREV